MIITVNHTDLNAYRATHKYLADQQSVDDCRNISNKPGLRYDRNRDDRHCFALLRQYLARLAHFYARLCLRLGGRQRGPVGVVAQPAVVHGGRRRRRRRELGVRRRVHVAVGRLADAHRRPADARLADRLDLHEERRLLRARHVERRVAVRLVALDAGTGAALLADVARQFPARRRDVLDTVNRLEEDGVREADLGDPECAHDVRPAAVVRLLERAALVRTEAAVDGARRRLEAAAAQPLALGDVRHAVALLVHRKVAHVAEQDHVAVLALAVHADAAHRVLVD